MVYDVSRWGRFQDADESAYYEYICKRAGIAVHYRAEQFANDGSPVSTIVKGSNGRWRGEYSRELSVKVFAGQCRLIELGFRQGGAAGYGLRRMRVDERGEPQDILARAQQKNLQTDRVMPAATMAAGDDPSVATAGKCVRAPSTARRVIVPDPLWVSWRGNWAFYFTGRIAELLPKKWKVEPHRQEDRGGAPPGVKRNSRTISQRQRRCRRRPRIGPARPGLRLVKAGIPGAIMPGSPHGLIVISTNSACRLATQQEIFNSARPMLRRLLNLLPPSWRAALQPVPVSTRERLAQFPTEALPLQRSVVLRWNDFQVPFIEAETDRDLAFTFGMVHAHLRGAQIALYKRIFYGRLSEIVGPWARDLDHAIRIIDFGYAVEEMERRLPEETREWVQGFVNGINHYHERAPRDPPEFALLGLRPEPYTRRDILVGARFAGTDSTWLTYFPLLARRGKPGFARLWNRTLEAGEPPMPSGRPDETEDNLEEVILNAGRLGSNSVAVSPSRSTSGGALLANDPHMALSLPNSWILLGLRSPSYNAVGLSIAGLPMIGLGRNPDLAWGGTNMLAASSDLYDVSRLMADSFQTRETRIASRWWFLTRRKIRRCAFGPIISDAKILKCRSKRPIALRWVGHEPTDELTAFLRAARARTPEEFSCAFADYGVCGENMLFAARNGNIGRVLAVTQPVRSGFPKDDMVLDAGDPQTHWRGFVGAKNLPFTLNPSSGVLCSANDKPTGTNLPIGFSFGSQDRLQRLYELLGKGDRLGFVELVNLQTDTRAPDAARLSSALAVELAALPDAKFGELARRLRAWDGDYSADSTGAAAFEAFLYHLVSALHGRKKPTDLPDLFGEWSYLTTFLLSDLAQVAPPQRQVLLREAARAAMLDVQRYAKWGDMHRLRVAHSIARVRVIRRDFTIADLPVGGSRQTPMKMGHGLVNGRHTATFGSMARHISDLSDVDANWFVVLGGQDGWLGSANFADQLPLWQERRYIRMPLRPEVVSTEFPIVQNLRPMRSAVS